jgi:signal transduction histidine kinase
LTERRQSEARLEQSNAHLTRTSRLKSEFLARMSHELRAPMNGIVGYLDLLLEESGGPLSQEQQRFLHHIRQGAGHVLELVNHLLDLSKIESGHAEVRFEPLAVPEVAGEVLAVLQPLADAKRIVVSNESEPQLTVWADRLQFKQVLFNLLSNAVKFTPEGGRVWIESLGQDGKVSISVCDTGVGISLQDQQAIFGGFHRVPQPGGDETEGTGLGLAITKQIAESHGGTLQVESELGKGSRFIFTLTATRPN